MTREPTEMESRVNLAIRAAFFDHIGQVWPADVGIHLARSAIRAMREPTEGMIEAGYDEDGGRYITWIRMIHAASPGDE